MFNEYGLNGTRLIDVAVSIAATQCNISAAHLKIIAQSALEHYKFFDGEPIDPIWFAEKILIHAGRRVA